MKKVSLILGMLLCLISCSKSETETEIQQKNIVDKKDGYSEFIVYPNSKLEITTADGRTFGKIEQGNKLVFEYIFHIESKPGFFDSGYSEYLYFEMDAKTEDFQLKTEDMTNASAYLRKSCYCPNTDFKPVTSGVINAKKTGSMEWEIEFEVESTIIEDGETVEIIALQNSGTFKPE